MAALNTVVFSASIDNEDAIRRWVESVQEQAGVARQALEELAGLLNKQPHIAISLTTSQQGAEGMSTTGDDLIAVHLHDGVGRIAQERKRQVTEEGWTPEHDAHHVHELTDAALSYVLAARDEDWLYYWPRMREDFKGGTPIRCLEKAGALLAAEIDRRLAAGER